MTDIDCNKKPKDNKKELYCPILSNKEVLLDCLQEKCGMYNLCNLRSKTIEQFLTSIMRNGVKVQ